MIKQRVGNKKGGCVYFGHGWGQDAAAFSEVVEALRGTAECVLLDFPGVSPKAQRPQATWGVDDYANQVSKLIAAEDQPVIWAGHSFGGRVGLTLGSAYPDNIAGLVLVASAGIPRTRNWQDRLKSKLRRPLYLYDKRMADKDEAARIAFEEKWGSADYIQSRKDGMRDIFLKVINENQTDKLSDITLPTKLIYGAEDVDTPPEIGMRMRDLIPNAELTILNSMGHLEILWRGRHIIALQIKELLEETKIGAAK